MNLYSLLDIPKPIEQYQKNNNKREFFVLEKMNALSVCIPQGSFGIIVIV
jgi:hypothetical protein